jgi:hypothetical protein
MPNNPIEKMYTLFLFPDTGGDHRTATDAIIEALN